MSPFVTQSSLFFTSVLESSFMNLKNIFKCIFFCIVHTCVSIVLAVQTNNGYQQWNQFDFHIQPKRFHFDAYVMLYIIEYTPPQWTQHRQNQKNERSKRNKSNKYYRVDTDFFVLCYLHPFHLFIFFIFFMQVSLSPISHKLKNIFLYTHSVQIQTFPSLGSLTE